MHRLSANPEAIQGAPGEQGGVKIDDGRGFVFFPYKSEPMCSIIDHFLNSSPALDLENNCGLTTMVMVPMHRMPTERLRVAAGNGMERIRVGPRARGRAARPLMHGGRCFGS